MGKVASRLVVLAYLAWLLVGDGGVRTLADETKVYIVRVSKSGRPEKYGTHTEWYDATLGKVREARRELLHVYETVFHGFSTKMSETEAEALGEEEGVLSVVPDVMVELQTTHSPDFLGIGDGQLSWRWPWPIGSKIVARESIIVGVIDTGVWPEHPSFSDSGRIGPVPHRWRGTCELFASGSDRDPLCNRKLLGARAFYKGYVAARGIINETISPRDTEGHGTHTASTAAGVRVPGASLFGLAPGTARGMAPDAHVAVYKACWSSMCSGSDVLAAIDAAVADGVDIISASLGGSALPYHIDPLAAAAFGAMEKGVLTTFAAGNSGPEAASVNNVAPWVLTVAAGSMDRAFLATASLGDGARYSGESSYSERYVNPVRNPMPFIYPVTTDGSQYCASGSLSSAQVAGKVVLCDRGDVERTEKSVAVKLAGGIAMVLANAEANGNELVIDIHAVPTIAVSYRDGIAMKAYIQSASQPTIKMSFHGTVLGVKPAPILAAFSGRGPNPVTLEILKPDIAAPGINILAAWTGSMEAHAQLEFKLLSGTSMACPHVAGLAAIVKAVHPDWSPAAIKSALMTTSRTVDNTGRLITDAYDATTCTSYCYGAGYVNPLAAVDPGLVYNLTTQDYVDFLCAIGYSRDLLSQFANGDYQCSNTPKPSLNDFNYPAISVVFTQTRATPTFRTTIFRTLTNVGNPESIYSSIVRAPAGVEVHVNPRVLVFSRTTLTQRFSMSFEASAAPDLRRTQILPSFGLLVWADRTHEVRTPIVFT